MTIASSSRLPFTSLMVVAPVAFAVLAACAGSSPAPPSTANAAPDPSASSAASSAGDSGATPPSAVATESQTSPEGGAPDTSGTPRERLMRSHFREANLIRKAVIDGVVADAVAPADALAKTEGLGKIEPSWQSSIDVLQYAARRIQRSSDIPGTAAAIADIGIACGACHKAAGGPRVKPDAPPASDSSIEGRMRRHVWATERLWEGIYGPSDASWKAGADALSGDPFPKETLDAGGVHARSAASRFKSLVPALAAKKTPQERGQIYASLLETCSACHIATRRK